jgi:hypothetical protein
MLRRSRTSVALMVALLPLAFGAASAGGDSSGPPPKPGATGSPSEDIEPQDDALVAAARAAEKIGKPDTAFSGVSIDMDKRLVNVFRVDGASNLSKATLAAYNEVAPEGVTVQFIAAPVSLMQKNAIDDLVDRYSSGLTAAGVDVNAWGLLDGFDHAYRIEYSGSGTPPTDVVKALNVYGDGTVVFTPGKTMPL